MQRIFKIYTKRRSRRTNNKQEIQAPKITRNKDGTYLAKFEIEGTSREELEGVFKEVEETKKWTDENCKDNTGGGFRNGKHKNATKHILD